MGGGVGIADHLTIGAGAQLAARQRCHEQRAGGRGLGRLPAEPMAAMMRQIATLEEAHGGEIEARRETMAENSLESLDILELLKLLPHRYPFLLIDKIVDIDGDNSAVGIKNVTFNEPHFQGHFPGQPVMPGVLIIEAMAQVAGAISLKAAGSDKPSLVYFLTIDDAKFRKPVVPGDRLEIRVQQAQEARQHLALRLRGLRRRSEGGGSRDRRDACARG